MKKIFVVISVLYTLTANSQNYLISFEGTGASSTVNSIKVENLMSGRTLTLNGDDILHLTGTTGIYSTENDQSSGIKIYPNPMTENSVMEVYPPVAGDAVITVYDMTGRQLFRKQSYLDKSRMEFTLSGFKNGLYLINVKGNSYQITGQLFCTVGSAVEIKIEKISNNLQSVYSEKSEMDFKGTGATVDMQYSTGDRLKFIGISGIYSTVIMDIPTSSKTLTFTFIACTDGDANNYSIIKIGTQMWMAENLKTTKYNTGLIIPLESDNSIWANLAAHAYCWYNNEVMNKNIYGALYNWYTIGNSNLCPAGWHVPLDQEWTTLQDYIGYGLYAGGKLKETGTVHWITPNRGATNETGFTALPGGLRNINGLFGEIGLSGVWWSSTETSSTAWARSLQFNEGDIYKGASPKKYGHSVRCLKDN